MDSDRLLRFVLSPTGELVPDLDGKLPGRGAYTCISARCLETAVRQRQFSRGFKCEVTLPPLETVIGMVAGLLKDRVIGAIGLANKAGKVVSGGSLVADSLRSANRPGLVLIATDVSESIGERLEGVAKMHSVPYRRLLTKDVFGEILGKAPRSALAVRQGGFVAQLKRTIERYSMFLGEEGVA